MVTYFFDGGDYTGHFPTIIHKVQYGFISGQDIIHNILYVHMAMEFANMTNQESVMVLLGLEKAYDNVDWFFVRESSANFMGFGKHKFTYTWGRALFLISCLMANYPTLSFTLCYCDSSSSNNIT